MQEFRPPSVIEADDRLATGLAAGDEAAVRALVDRWGSPITSLAVRLVDDERAGRRLAERAVRDAAARAHELSPGDAPAPWLAALTVAAARGSIADLEPDEATVAEAWTVADATARLDPGVRERLRDLHVGTGADDRAADDDRADVDVDDVEVAAARVRLERRLAHLPDGGRAALADPRSWLVADPDLADRVLPDPEPGADDDPAVAPSTPPEAPGRRRGGRVAPVVVGVGAALAVLLVTIVGLSALAGEPTPEDLREPMVATGLLPDVDGGEVAMTQLSQGLRIELDAPSLPRRGGDTAYAGVLVLDDGDVVAVGGFNEGADVELTAGVELARVRSFLVVEDDLAGAPSTDRVVLELDLPGR